MVKRSGRQHIIVPCVRFEAAQFDFPIYSRADLLVNPSTLQTRNFGGDALGLERRVDDAQSDPGKPEPIGRLVRPLCPLWGQSDELDCVGPDDSVIGEIEEVCHLSRDGRELFAQRTSSLGGTQRGLQVFDRFGQPQHCVWGWLVHSDLKGTSATHICVPGQGGI